MTKKLAAVMAAATLTTTLIGLTAHNPELSFFMDTTNRISLLRAALVLMTCLYCFLPWIRWRASQGLMFVIGFGLVYVALAGLFTARLFGMVTYFTLPLDVFFALEWGYVALLLALEAPIKRLEKTPARIARRIPVASFIRIKHA